MSACDVPFSVARLLGPLLVLGWPEPARAPGLRRMQGAGDARLTVEPKGSVGVDCGARGRSVRAEWSRAGARLMLLVVLVMIRRGAAGRRRFRRVPLMSTERRTAVRGQVRERAARRLRAAVALPAVKRFVTLPGLSRLPANSLGKVHGSYGCTGTPVRL